MRSSNDDDITDDEWRCVETDVEIAVLGEAQTLGQVDPAAGTELRVGQPGRRIE